VKAPERALRSHYSEGKFSCLSLIHPRVDYRSINRCGFMVAGCKCQIAPFVLGQMNLIAIQYLGEDLDRHKAVDDHL
jgi:hypothetical protein